MTVHVCRDLVLGSNTGYATGSYDTMWAIGVFLQGVLGFTFQSSGGSLVPPAYADFTVNYYSCSFSTNTLTVISSSVISRNSGSCFMTSSSGNPVVQFSTDTVNLLSAAYPVGWPPSSGAWPGVNPFGGGLAAGYGNPFNPASFNAPTSPGHSWIAIRSNQFPLANSGIFAVNNSTSYLSGNALGIDYRSPSAALIETGSLMTASLWVPPPGSDANTTLRTGNYPSLAAMHDNGGAATSYKSQGSSTFARMILTSPSPLAWQVRLAMESSTDRTFQGQAGSTPTLTAIPGFSGSNGDFPVVSYNPGNRSYHLHLPQYFNSTLQQYANTMPGLDTLNIATVGVGGGYSVKYRFYAWGDDTTGTCGVFIRNQTNASDCFCMFGQAENEVLPHPQLEVQRLFFIGQTQWNQGIDWRCGAWNTDGIGGMAFSLNPMGGPISCVFCTYAYASGQGSNFPPGGNSDNGGSIRFDKNGPFTPFLSGAIELLSSDLIAGTWDNYYNPTSFQNILPLEPRMMGRTPFARFGSSISLATWATIDTPMSWFHITNGFFMPWGGVAGL